MQAVFHREIGRLIFSVVLIPVGKPGIRRVHIGIEPAENMVVEFEESRVLRRRIDLHPSDRIQEAQRIMVYIFPQVIIDPIIKTLGVRSSGPPKVIGQFTEAVDPAREIEMIGDFCSIIQHYDFSKYRMIPNNKDIIADYN